MPVQEKWDFEDDLPCGVGQVAALCCKLDLRERSCWKELRCSRGLKPRQRVDELAESNAKSPRDRMYGGPRKEMTMGGISGPAGLAQGQA